VTWSPRCRWASLTAVAMLDLPYEEDSRAETDMNVVHDRCGRLRRGAGYRLKWRPLPGRTRPVARSGYCGHRGDPRGSSANSSPRPPAPRVR